MVYYFKRVIRLIILWLLFFTDSVFNPFSAWTVLRRQNLMCSNVRFWRLKTVPALKD